MSRRDSEPGLSSALRAQEEILGGQDTAGTGREGGRAEQVDDDQGQRSNAGGKQLALFQERKVKPGKPTNVTRTFRMHVTNVYLLPDFRRGRGFCGAHRVYGVECQPVP